MKLFLQNKTEKFLSISFFAIALIIGLLTFSDYGMNWDEQMQRIDNGTVNYNFIVSRNSEQLIHSNEKYHGPVFELLLVAIEKIIHLTDTHEIYLMRHLVTFLLFWLSLFFFYKILKKITGNDLVALTGALFLFLSPRIFADSFHNSKDIAFLSVFIITCYTSIQFHNKKSFANAALHGLLTGILIDIRITGIIVPLTDVIILTGSLFFSTNESGSLKRNAMIAVSWLSVLLFSIVLFWPVLWLNPFHHFMQAFYEMRNYNYDVGGCYFGKPLSSKNLPWHYVPGWMSVTTPLLYSFLFVTGICFLVFNLFRNVRNFFTENKALIIPLLLFAGPLAGIIVFHSVIYDGWRHMFFIYPMFLIVAVYGLYMTVEKIKSKRKRQFIFAGIYIYLGYITLTMFKNHPYNNVYFNELLVLTHRDTRELFDTDYYGVSCKQGLEYVLAHDTEDTINIKTNYAVGEFNADILPAEQRKRIHFPNAKERVDYLIVNYRWMNRDPPIGYEIFSIKCYGAKILSVYKMWTLEQVSTRIKPDFLLFSSQNNFEKQHLLWKQHYIDSVTYSAHSGTRVTAFDSIHDYGAELVIDDDALLEKLSGSVVKINFWGLYLDTAYNTSFVVVVNDKEDKNITWNGERLSSIKENKDSWNLFEAIVKLPEKIDTSQVLKTYLWSTDRKTFCIDDVTIEFYSLK